MMHVLICEDDLGQRAQIESIVSRHIATEDVEMELILSTGNPIEVLNYLKIHPDKRGLYFLDIDLQHREMDGMELATIIRKTDPYAKIVFITTHSEKAYLTYKHKLGALDFIVKERPQDVETRTIGCILAAYKCYLEEKSELMKSFQVNANGEVWKIPHEDILYFETDSEVGRRIILHTEKSEVAFRGSLRDVVDLGPEFYCCHRSFIVNLNKIARIDKNAKEVEMVNGAMVYVARQKMSELLRLIGDRQGLSS